MTAAESQHRFRVIVAFALVYFFWGSTYLGIGIAVEHIPPYLMTGTRFFIAGVVMLAWCALRGRRIAISLADGVRLGVIGCLLLSISNPVLAHAEEIVPTGLAALILAVTPLWFLVIDAWIMSGDHVPPRGIVGLGLGIVGVAVLLWPKLTATTALGHREFVAGLTLIGGSVSWALGSVFAKRWQMQVDPFSASGWEMAIAGAVNLLAAFAFGEQHQAQWTARGIGAIVYLIIFGSWVGYSAYIWLLQHVPTSKVATYAYVNPVVAVFLGWLVLNERVDGYILAGSAIVVASVALVTSSKVRSEAGEEHVEEMPACEST